jgi:hypothetical protein
VIKLQVDIPKLNAVKARIDNLVKDRQNPLFQAIVETTIDVHKDVKESLSKKGTGVTRKLYQPNRIHTASSPNNPPATDQGFLKKEVRYRTKVKEFYGVVISGANYSRALEFGYPPNNLEERPFLRPALEKNFDKFKNRVKQVFK